MKQITMTIDGMQIQVDADKTVLEASLEQGIYIPHLCHHENLHESGGCRLCVVEQEGVEGVITSCSTPVTQGMVIHTKTELAENIRKLSVDLMFKTHPAECTGCPKYGKCQLMSISQYVGDTGRNLRELKIRTGADESNPLMVHEMYRCILCGRCVRACEDLRGVGALGYQKINDRLQVVVKGDSLKDADCRFCGACVEVCPTGSIRDKIGVVKEQTPRELALVPCTDGCPANIQIPKYIRFLKEGNYPAAAAVVREKAPMPEVLGYICTHDCESACKRNHLNSAVSIRNLKRYAAAHDDGSWKQHSVRKPRTGKKVAIIGAGPAGLTAAYYLDKLGHKVTVYDSQMKPGGMLRYGIPSYRLPREVIDREVQEILGDTIDYRPGTRITSARMLLEQDADAVFVATGTHRGVKLPLVGNDLKGVYLNTEFLRTVNEENCHWTGSKVVVLGGGNVAVDCASTAARLGAQTVHMVCLESPQEMKASKEEITWATEEGIQIHNKKTFLEITGKDGQVTGIRLAAVSRFYFDDTGKAVIEQEPDSEMTLEADTIIFAVGQIPDLDEQFGIGLGRGNRIVTDALTMATDCPGIYAAGDAVTGTASVIKAIAGARKAVSAIDRYLGGDGDIEEKLAPDQNPQAWIGKTEGFADLLRNEPHVEDAAARCRSFAAMDHGFGETETACEANRCLQCDLRLQIAPQKFWSDYVPAEGGNPYE